MIILVILGPKWLGREISRPGALFLGEFSIFARTSSGEKDFAEGPFPGVLKS